VPNENNICLKKTEFYSFLFVDLKKNSNFAALLNFRNYYYEKN